ncbi:MAG: hypothetical protein NC343_01205 [Muribaculum sp.]|nr:hypothetical protein [Muribaculaceae bacterium]MCM1080353.1 hypothetical protein [Muribaculum sp.]
MSTIVVNLAQLSDAICQATSVPRDEVEKFVISLTGEISARLAAGERAEVPGLGTFVVGGMNDNTVMWCPDEALQQQVNAPFSFFEPVELANGLSAEMLDQPMVLSQSGFEQETDSETDMLHIGTKEDNTNDTEAVEAVESEQVQKKEPEPVNVEELDPETSADGNSPDKAEEPANDQLEDPVPQPVKGHFGWMELLLGMVIGLIVGFIAAIYSPNPQLLPIRQALSGDYVAEIEEDTTAVFQAETINMIVNADTATIAVEASTVAMTEKQPATVVDEAKPSVADNEIYDTVTSSRYLTTMARKYYGDYHFWIYIYLYNKDIIANPDRIPAGTRVKIPRASAYGIDANSPQSVAKAQRLIEELRSK